ncbi:MAG: hypothetical protein DRI90_10625 [Deltaproteobacteria bacterium]|nr:MAG: hypothetical protein DRI90_10625 [Deltaproteobacteria bacterium]
MSRSHAFAPKPTSLLALIALGVVARFQRRWLAVDLQSACAEQGVGPERLSRLVSLAIERFEAVVAVLTRRGRPPREHDRGRRDVELAITTALLEVATALLRRLTLRRRLVGELVVGAWLRLRELQGLTQKRFCEALHIPERTLRQWQRRPPQAPPRSAPSAEEPSKRRRRTRRGRFGFDVLLPGTQVGADTTDLSAFGIPLKLIAAQDIGGRDQALFDAVLVDDHESAELVAQVLTEALRDRPGAQAITDQGTPYLAKHTRQALDDLEAEHAPQREADPIGKATVERAFRSVKSIAGPLLGLTDRIAQALPPLRHAALAKAGTTVLLTALLRAYQHGARAARAALEARGSIDPEQLERSAEASRERARATDHSAKLLLGHLHEIYHLADKITDFVRAFRRYPLVVLHEADRILSARLLRDDLESVRDPWRYFGALVRRLYQDHRRQQARRRRDADERRQLSRQDADHAARSERFHAEPLAWLRHALDFIASGWLPAAGALVFADQAIHLAQLRPALRRLAQLHGPALSDLALGLMHDFRLAHQDRLGDHGADAVEKLLRAELAKLDRNDHCAPSDASAILTNTGKTPRPPPSGHLPN